MTDRTQPEALRLANEFTLCNEYDSIPSMNDITKAEAELRRLHAENTTLQQGYDAARLEIESLQAKLEAIGAGGVEPLRRRKCLHQISEPTPRRTDWLEQLGFELREHGNVWLVVDDCGHEREATLTERVLWDALMQADAAAPSSAPARDLNGAALASARHLLEADPKAHAATVIQMLDAMAQQEAPTAVAGPSDSEIDALVVSIGPTEGIRKDSRDLTMDKLRVLVRRALATWGHVKVAPVNAWQQAIDHEPVTAHLGVAGAATLEEARKAPRTIKIGSREVEAPILTPTPGQIVYRKVDEEDWAVDVVYHPSFKCIASEGRYFASPEAAIAAHDAIVALLRGEDC